eukprot:scaffold2200_cov413-Prasinococcus_capsulatus_cf.AAC.17
MPLSESGGMYRDGAGVRRPTSTPSPSSLKAPGLPGVQTTWQAAGMGNDSRPHHGGGRGLLASLTCGAPRKPPLRQRLRAAAAAAGCSIGGRRPGGGRGDKGQPNGRAEPPCVWPSAPARRAQGTPPPPAAARARPPLPLPLASPAGEEGWSTAHVTAGGLSGRGSAHPTCPPGAVAREVGGAPTAPKGRRAGTGRIEKIETVP